MTPPPASPPTEQTNCRELTPQKPESKPSSASSCLCDLSLPGPQFLLDTSKSLNTDFWSSSQLQDSRALLLVPLWR